MLLVPAQVAAKDTALSITEAFADIHNDLLFITGRGFDSKSLLAVSLGETGDFSENCVADLVATPQTITCDFPLEGLPVDGDYLLTVATYKGG